MTQIPITREKRLLIRKWLKQGYIDNVDLSSLNSRIPKMTLEEMNAEIKRLSAIDILRQERSDLMQDVNAV